MSDKSPKYQIDRTAVFRRDLKRAKKRGLDISLLDAVILALQYGEEQRSRRELGRSQRVPYTTRLAAHISNY